VDDSGLIVTIWVSDLSFLDFWVDDLAWVGDPKDVVELFLMVAFGRANLKLLPVLLPPLREVPVALGGMTVFL